MDVSLTPELERIVEEKVRSGEYASISEVMREAVRALHERDQARAVRLAELRRNVATGVEQSKRGDVVDGEEFFDRLLQQTREEARSRRGR